MIDINELGARFILGITIGDMTIKVSESALFCLIAAVILAILGIWMGSGLKKIPKGKQIIAESTVKWVYDYTEKNLGAAYTETFAPYVGTVFVFVFVASAFGLFGFRPITADINVTGGLAIMSFLVIQFGSLRYNGFLGAIKELFEPYPFMFPIHIIEKITLPITLALRLFGNIFGGMLVIELWMHFMEFLSNKITTIPFLRAVLVIPLNGFFDIFEPAIQTYIFAMLTVMNLKLAIATHESTDNLRKKDMTNAKRLTPKAFED
ncbi:MAG: F0F1 ATP synthase subunit A [Eubacterium sp.]|nr:F0F1 ATP synthase subunit A [Eubacterium sp.]